MIVNIRVSTAAFRSGEIDLLVGFVFSAALFGAPRTTPTGKRITGHAGSWIEVVCNVSPDVISRVQIVRLDVQIFLQKR